MILCFDILTVDKVPKGAALITEEEAAVLPVTVVTGESSHSSFSLTMMFINPHHQPSLVLWPQPLPTERYPAADTTVKTRL